MGNNLFGANISGKIAKAFGNKLLTGTITQFTPGTRTTTDRAGGTNPVPSTCTFKGMFEQYLEQDIDGERVLANDRKVMILGDTLRAGVVPGGGDEIKLEGDTVKVIRLVERDPDAATYVVQVR